MSGKGTSTISRPDAPPRASDRGRSRLGDVTRPVHIERRIATTRRTTAALAVVALGIAGALALALFGLPLQTYFGQNDRLDQRSEQLARLETVNADLRAEVSRLGTDDGVREAAREQLGFVESGERRLTVLDAPPVPTDLPDGWPYGVISDIVELRRNPPTPTAPGP